MAVGGKHFLTDARYSGTAAPRCMGSRGTGESVLSAPNSIAN